MNLCGFRNWLVGENHTSFAQRMTNNKIPLALLYQHEGSCSITLFTHLPYLEIIKSPFHNPGLKITFINPGCYLMHTSAGPNKRYFITGSASLGQYDFWTFTRQTAFSQVTVVCLAVYFIKCVVFTQQI